MRRYEPKKQAKLTEQQIRRSVPYERSLPGRWAVPVIMAQAF
jgi:hypothetical protein